MRESAPLPTVASVACREAHIFAGPDASAAAATARPARPVGPAPPVSVVVPCYNAASTLSDTLTSLRRQSYRRFEAVVVNDGSTDNSLEIANRFASADPRFRALSQPNGGVSTAYNRGVQAATGEWVLFLDADDLLRPTALARLLAAAERSPSAGVVVGGSARVDSAGRLWRTPRWDLSEPFTKLAYECAIGVIHTALVRRDLVIAVGGFDETLRTSEDWDLWQRIARTGVPFVQIEAEVALYRSQPGSLSKNIRQLVADTFTVLGRGGRPDPRVPFPAPAYANGAPAEAQPRFRLNFLLWSAARDVAAGGDGASLFDWLGEEPDLDLDPEEAGEMLAEGMADYLTVQPRQLANRWREFAPKLKAVLARAFPGADRARLRDVVLLTIKNRLQAPFDGSDGEVVGEARVDPRDGLAALAGPGRGPVAVQLWSRGPIGVVAKTGLGCADPAAMARSFTEQIRGLAMVGVPASAQPWRSLRFWPSFLGRLVEGGWMTATAAIGYGRLPTGFVRQRLRYAFVGGLQSELGLHLARGSARAMASAPRPRTGTEKPRRSGLATRVPILMYHQVSATGPDALSRYRVDPAAFRQQIELLASNGFWTPSAAAWRAALDANRPLDERAVLLTFDDGYANFAEQAWPLLREHGFSALVFVVAGKVGGVADWDEAFGEPAPLMDWPTLRALSAEGVEVGSHSQTHPRMSRLTLPQGREEVLRSRDTIEERLRTAPRTFAYPFGLRDPFVQEAIAECGYSLGVTSAEGVSDLSCHPLRLPRIEVTGGEELGVFARRLGLDAPQAC